MLSTNTEELSERSTIAPTRRTIRCAARRGAPWLVAICASTLAACGDGSAPADARADRVVDSATQMDADVAMDTGAGVADTGVSVMDTGALFDAPPSNACCRAFSPANQGVCDGLESRGPSVCNMHDDGTACTWSLEPRCNDSGVILDTGLPNCCLAISPANAALCSALSPFGRDRCNRADGGGTCVWSGASVCNPPVDSGVDAAMDAARDAGVDAGVDTGVDVRTDTGVDTGVAPSCCLARTGSRGTTCSMNRTEAMCAAQAALYTCVWATTALCTSSLGLTGACCIPRSNPLLNSTCGNLSSVTNCRTNTNCQWRCP